MKVAGNIVTAWALLLLCACATVGPPEPPSLELPKPPVDLRAVRKGNVVTLSWTVPSKTTDRQTVRSTGATWICRSTDAALTQCGKPVGEAGEIRANAAPGSKKIATSYIDSLPVAMQSDSPDTFATYAVEPLNAYGRGAGLSNQARIPLVRTPVPPESLSAQVTSRGVVLSWANDLPQAGAGVQFAYRLLRRVDGTQPWILAGEISAGSARSFTDNGIEWEKTYEYRGEAVTSFQANGRDWKVEGEDSPTVKVFAHDVFPPQTPTGLQAVFSGPGQQAFVDLIWAPVPDVDLDGYNVYRHEEGAAPVKVNAALVKSPAYRDAAVASGRKYSYSVSAVDVRGNESAKSEEAEESVP